MALVNHNELNASEGESGISGRQISSREFGAASSAAFDVTLRPGAEVPVHYHGVDSTIVFLAGTFRVTQGDQTWTVGPGHTLVSGPGVVHGLKNVGQSEARMLTFHPSLEFKTIPAE